MEKENLKNRKFTLFVFCEFPLTTKNEFDKQKVKEVEINNFDFVNEFSEVYPNKIMFEPEDKKMVIERILFLDPNILNTQDNYLLTCVNRGLSITEKERNLVDFINEILGIYGNINSKSTLPNSNQINSIY